MRKGFGDLLLLIIESDAFLFYSKKIYAWVSYAHSGTVIYIYGHSGTVIYLKLCGPISTEGLGLSQSEEPPLSRLLLPLPHPLLSFHGPPLEPCLCTSVKRRGTLRRNDGGRNPLFLRTIEYSPSS